MERADIVLAMTPSHLQSVEMQGGEAKAVMLGEFLDGPEAGEPIADPFGGTAAEYAEARDRIARAVDGLLDRLSAILAP